MEHAEQGRVKVGIALSGGGFRASFFHIGVLARLAELDLLRRVEVLSTVSGGSIVGALYYLHVKTLLETKPDEAIARDDYVELVGRLERDFRAATDKNIRSLTFANPLKNLRMALPSYSRSDRIGDLYDRLFYRPAWQGATGPIEMRQLKIHPVGDPNREVFNPTHHNEPRRAKVPRLLINATSLNNGRSWRFEAARMGEPAPIEPELRDVLEDVDKNVRYAQGDYDALTPRQVNFPLGAAVAASAGVPMLFHPLSVSGLFEDSRVQLVDGGVHDNQGVQSLLDTHCTHLLLSDASGQMGDLPNPITRLPAVAGRSISIYGDSLRDEQLVRAQERPRSTALMHLRKGLTATVVFPLGADGRPLAPDVEERTGPITCEDFGVDAEVQKRLSRFRTDLDSFTEVEAWALGLDGYRMTSEVVARTPGVAALADPAAAPDEARWDFGAVAAELREPSPTFLRHLDAANGRFFKAAALLPGLRHAPKLLAAALLVALLLWRRDDLLEGTIPIWGVLLAVVFGAAYLFTGTTPVLRMISGVLPSTVAPIVLAIPLWLMSLAVLAVNPLFLAMGRASRVVRTHREERPPEAPRVPTQP